MGFSSELLEVSSSESLKTSSVAESVKSSASETHGADRDGSVEELPRMFVVVVVVGGRKQERLWRVANILIRVLWSKREPQPRSCTHLGTALLDLRPAPGRLPRVTSEVVAEKTLPNRAHGICRLALRQFMIVPNDEVRSQLRSHSCCSGF